MSGTISNNNRQLDLRELLLDSDLSSARLRAYLKKLKKDGITDIEQLYAADLNQLIDNCKILVDAARKLYNYVQEFKRSGSCFRTISELRDDRAEYLTSGSMSIDEMLTTAAGDSGLPVGSIIELWGKAGTGKTTLAINYTMLCMRDKQEGGWSRDVIYIDTKDELTNRQIRTRSKFWRVENYGNRFRKEEARSVEELEFLLDNMDQVLMNHDVGLLVIDSYYDLFATTLPVDGVYVGNNRERDRKHYEILGKLRYLANKYNMIVIITNDVKKLLHRYGSRTGPRGGISMRHLVDISIKIDKPTKRERKFLSSKMEDIGMRAIRTTISKSRWHSESKGFGLQTDFGIVDPTVAKKIYKISERLRNSTDWVDSYGNIIPDFRPDVRRERDDTRDRTYDLK